MTVVGETLTEMGLTVNGTPLLAKPPTVTTTLPVVAPAGTVTKMVVSFHPLIFAAAPLKVTVLFPCERPKLAPLIVIEAPTGPEAGFRLVMFGGGASVKSTPLLAMPPTVTTTFPDVAPAGTGAMISVGLQDV